MNARTWPRRLAGTTEKNAFHAVFDSPRCVTSWVNFTPIAVRDPEGHEPHPEPEEVRQRQEQRHGDHAQARVQAVRDERGHQERCRGHRGGEQSEGRGELALAGERGGHRAGERVLHGVEEDREQHVGDRDQPHQRRPRDVQGTRAQCPQRAHPRAVRVGDRMQARAQSHQRERGHDEQHGVPDDDRGGADEGGQRPRRQQPHEAAADRGARAQREQPPGLAGVERRSGDRPQDRREQRARREHRHPGHRVQGDRTGHRGDALEGEDRRDDQQDRGHDPLARRPRDDRPIPERRDQPDGPQPDVQRRQDRRSDGIEDQRRHGDFAESPPRLGGREREAQQRYQSAFAGADGERSCEPVHVGRTGDGGSRRRTGVDELRWAGERAVPLDTMMACAGDWDTRRPVSRRSRLEGDPRRRTHQRPPGLQVDRSGDAGDRAAADPDAPSRPGRCATRPARPSTVPWLATYGDVTRRCRSSHSASEALRLPVTGSSTVRAVLREERPHLDGRRPTRRVRSDDADVEVDGPGRSAEHLVDASQQHGDPARPVVDPLRVHDGVAVDPSSCDDPVEQRVLDRSPSASSGGAANASPSVAAPDGDQPGRRTPAR